MKTIFRKLKEYIHTEGNVTTHIFGTLTSTECVWRYETEHEYKDFKFDGHNCKKYEFLLEYYVTGIFPSFEMDANRIEPRLIIILDKKRPEL